MKIYLFETRDWEKATFDPIAEDHDLRFTQEALEPDNTADFEEAEIVSVFVHSDLSEATLKKLPNLKAVATRSTGFDHIDLDYCEAHGIGVANVPSYGENTVASHTIGLLLNIAHRISDGVDRTRKGDFSNRGLRGFDVMGKTLGVIGATGNIGRHVVRMARGLGMEVLGQDVEEDADYAEEAGFSYVDMETLCAKSNVVTVHVPYSEKTHHLLGKEQFSNMRKGTVFLNTSRGGVVDEHALLEALSSGKVAAAGLDVIGAEPQIREEAELLRTVIEEQEKWGTLLMNETLLRLRNVYVTPHNAFNTEEAIQRILDVTLENIEGFIDGKPKYLVNP
jgi:D-lactate dehydrogenase